jgi:hypothetical protein
VTLASRTTLQRREDETNTNACPRLMFKSEAARYSYDFQFSSGSLQLNMSLNEQTCSTHHIPRLIFVGEWHRTYDIRSLVLHNINISGVQNAG